MNKVLTEKLKEAVVAVLPISVIVTVINFVTEPMPALNFASFLFGALLLIFGMSLYSLGSDTAIRSMGTHIGDTLTASKKPPLIFLVAFVLGFIVTIAEPDLMVLAGQVESAIPKVVLLVTVAAGVGVFLLLAFLRVFFNVGLNKVLLISYGVLFAFAAALSLFVNDGLIPLAFDSGGVTTGPVTVPFIIALGVGVSANLGGKNAQDDSFGMIALCSVGPILSVILLSMFYNPTVSADAVRPASLTAYTAFGDVLLSYLRAFPTYLKEVGIALLPIMLFFFLFQCFTVRVPRLKLLRIFIGLLYTYVGLSVFLTAANVGFMPVGAHIGKTLASLPAKGWLIPVGMVIGASIVLAEPAVHVLNAQVEEITDGMIKQRTMLLVLSAAVACAVGLAMVRVLTGLSIWWILLPVYAVALALTFFVPKIFTGIAFDSGGVASGPMTTTFLLPLALGACAEVGGNGFTDAFGVVAFVAMTPLIALQILGAFYKIKRDKKVRLDAALEQQIAAEGEEIIDIAKFFAVKSETKRGGRVARWKTK